MNALDIMRALSSQGEVHNCNPGDVVFRSGDTGSSMFGILEGTMRLTWKSHSGEQKHEDIQAGHVFGVGALVMPDHRRLGTATAVTPCRLIEMNREKFLFAVQETPMFALALIASVDERLRDIKLGKNS